MAEAKNDRLGYARRYATLGWPVIPIHWITADGQCSCNADGCKNPGKHPLTKRGLKEASTDQATITAWYRRWPDANIAIRTGAVSGVFALDADKKNGGLMTLEDLEDRHGRLTGLCARSGGGGVHYLFRHSGPECRTTTNWDKGIDTRGDGGYILVEPSNHVSGGTYQWLDDDPLDGATVPAMPDWLLAKLHEKNRPCRSATIPSAEKPLLPGEVKKIRAALACIPADDYTTWLHVGFALRSTGAGEQAYELWDTWSRKSEKYDQAIQRKKWVDSLSPDGGVNMGTLIDIAKQHGYQPAQSRPPVPPIEVYAAEVEAVSGGGDPTYNAILDDEQRYSLVDLLQYVPDDHLLKRLSIDVAAATFLPVNTVFLMGLAVFSSVAAWRYCVRYQHGGRLPIGLYVVAEQPPGTGKTWCLSIFQTPFYAMRGDLLDDVTKEIKNLDAKIAGGEGSTEDHETRRELAEKSTRLKIPIFVTNATPEGLEQNILTKTGGFFAAVSSEQGLFNSLMGATYQTGERAAHNNDAVLTGFDGGYMGCARAKRDGYSGRVVGGVACFAQAGSVERVMAASNGTGLSERFLALVEPHFLGHRDHTKRGIIDTGLLDEYRQICGFFRDVLGGASDFESLDELKISEDGFGMIAAYQNKIEPYLRDGGRYSHRGLRGAAGKINMQILKMAANLHLTSGAMSISRNIPDSYAACAIDITGTLMEANLTLCRDKGLLGKKAEFSAVLALYERDQRPRTARIIQQAVHKVKPFSEHTGSKSTLIKTTLSEMVEQHLLVTFHEGRKVLYQLAQ